MHTFTKRIEDKKNQSNNTNNNKKNLKQKSLNRRTQSKIGDKKIHPTPLLMEVLINLIKTKTATTTTKQP